LRSRFYTVVFLMAFEPNTEFKQRTETWIRSRARHFIDHKQPVLEAVMPRLLSLLAHHPDYSAELDELVDHARYMLFYISLVATEANLGLIYKYAERVKQTQDALAPAANSHQVLSDLAQAVIRKWQDKKNWVFNAYPGKVGLPVGLYTALKSHDEAQAIAEKQLVPDGVDEKLDELLRAMDRKKVSPLSPTPSHHPHHPSTCTHVSNKATRNANPPPTPTPTAITNHPPSAPASRQHPNPQRKPPPPPPPPPNQRKHRLASPRNPLLPPQASRQATRRSPAPIAGAAAGPRA
jgi:sister-chromatid-cohesion protein PDS5